MPGAGPGLGRHRGPWLLIGGSIGFLWADTAQAPSGLYYRPAGASSNTVRELRRYYNSAAGIHLFTNNPAETAPGWNSEGVRAWVWSSRW